MLDGAAAAAYTAPVVVSHAGAHTFTVTVTDSLGRTATATSTWTITGVTGQPIAPTAVINLAGNLSSGTAYIGAVTATIAAADAGGPGVATVQYALDAGQLTPYTGAGIVVSTLGTHTLNVTVTDTAGNIGTATRTWSQISSPDHTKPTGTITLAGTLNGSTYKGLVTVTITGNDGPNGSGIGSINYTLDGAAQPAQPNQNSYTFPVASAGTHTVVATVTDMAGNVSTAVTKTWIQTITATQGSDVLVSSADQALLQQPTARLVFSASNDAGAVPAKQFTFTNTTGHAIAVSNIAISGANAGSFGLAGGQATSFTLAPGGSTTVSVVFHPSAPTGCPTGAPGTPTSTMIGNNVAQVATLTYTTNDGPPAQRLGRPVRRQRLLPGRKRRASV